MTEDRAETIALEALGWLAHDPELMGIFLGSTGASVEDLRAGAGSREMAMAVLDFLVMDDAWVAALCEAKGWSNETVLMARGVLQGEAGRHWT